MPKKKIVWTSDIHLDSMNADEIEKFIDYIASYSPDIILIGGDIGEAQSVVPYLERFEWALPEAKVCFVLGNHDFYNGYLEEVKESVRVLCRNSETLIFLDDAEPIAVSETAALVGAGCWADGRLGDYEGSEVMLNDYLLIEDLKGLSKAKRLEALNRLGDVAAALIREKLESAFRSYSEVYCLTHVPPFREACRHQGHSTDDNYLPHFSCKAVGDVMLDIMRERSDCRLTVLCGHTHGRGEARVLDNLSVRTAGAEGVFSV